MNEPHSLKARIISRLDELEAMEEAATKGPWRVFKTYGEMDGVKDAKGFDIIEPLYRRGYSVEEWNHTIALIATARNLFPGLLAFMRQQAEWALEGALYGDGGTQLAKDYLMSIAVAIGAEVEP